MGHDYQDSHKHSQVVHWVDVHPPGQRKKFGGQIFRGKL